jgi:hypothetical protein
MVAALLACHALGRTATSFPSVKKLFVQPFGAEKQDDLLRLSLLGRLKKSNEYQFVDNVSDVDAILKAKTAAADATINSSASITNPSGKAAYPIASFTWLLIPEQISDTAKSRPCLR